MKVKLDIANVDSSAISTTPPTIDTDWGKPGKLRKWFGQSYEVDINGGGSSYVALETFNGSIRVEKVD